mmetsp:Transcript_29255/g.74413  ORF Transcript_29255/g.74413 Transcript_29255/m.74413 type:complete len:290 (-) Transcript_29255:139-1008(-)
MRLTLERGAFSWMPGSIAASTKKKRSRVSAMLPTMSSTSREMSTTVLRYCMRKDPLRTSSGLTPNFMSTSLISSILRDLWYRSQLKSVSACATPTMTPAITPKRSSTQSTTAKTSQAPCSQLTQTCCSCSASWPRSSAAVSTRPSSSSPGRRASPARRRRDARSVGSTGAETAPPRTRSCANLPEMAPPRELMGTSAPGARIGEPSRTSSFSASAAGVVGVLAKSAPARCGARTNMERIGSTRKPRKMAKTSGTSTDASLSSTQIRAMKVMRRTQTKIASASFSGMTRR